MWLWVSIDSKKSFNDLARGQTQSPFLSFFLFHLSCRALRRSDGCLAHFVVALAGHAQVSAVLLRHVIVGISGHGKLKSQYVLQGRGEIFDRVENRQGFLSF